MYVGNQKARIHIGKAKLGMDEDTYRALLVRVTGKDSSAKMSDAERASVIVEMTRLGAFQHATRTLTAQQRACIAKWYKLRRMGVINSKDKSSFNRFIKERFCKWNLADLSDIEANKLYNMLEGWIRSAEAAAK